MGSCKELDKSQFPITQEWLDAGKCGEINKAIEQTKSAASKLSVSITSINSALEKAGLDDRTIPTLDEAYTSELTADPFDSAWTVDGGEPLKQRYDEILGAIDEAYASILNFQDSSRATTDVEIVEALNSAELLTEGMRADIGSAMTAQEKVIALNTEYQEKIQEDVSVQAMRNPEAGQLSPAGLAALGRTGVTVDKDSIKKARKAKEEIDKEADKLMQQGIGALDPNENYLKIAFREQCFVQANLFELVKERRSGNFVKKGNYPGPGKQACLMAGGDPFGFINTLTQSPTTSTMFSIPPEILSQLQPEVRLYKIVSSGEKSVEEEIEITFPGSTTRADVKEIFKNKKRRGFGVGMKSFNWTYDGSDPFSTKKSIRAKLVIYATTFAELLRDRGGYRYADLALKTGKLADKVPPHCADSVNDTILNATEKLDFRLKAVVGYAIPKKLAITRTNREDIEKAIADSFVTLELTPTIHDFGFDDAGRVTFTLNYLAYIEDFFDDFYYDIFSSGGKNTQDAYRLRMQKAFDTANSQTSTAEAPEEDSKALKALQNANLKSLLTRLFKRDRMYYYQIPIARLNQAAIGAVLPVYDTNKQITNVTEVRNEIDSLRQRAKEQSDDANKQRLEKEAGSLQTQLDRASPLGSKEAQRHGSDINRQVTFFFLYDLVDVILSGINSALTDVYPRTLGSMGATDAATLVKKQEMQTLKRMQANFANLRVLLGPMTISNPRNKKEFMNVSLGEIPISAKYFAEWMADKMLAHDRTGYTLSAFLNSFIKNYLRNFLNDNSCGGDKFRQRTSLFNASITSYAKEDDVDVITRYLSETNQNRTGAGIRDVWVAPENSEKYPRPFLNTMGSRVAHGPRSKGQVLQKNWMIFYAGRVKPSKEMTGNRAADEKRGIHHYMLGSDKGIVKTITLNKKAVTGLKELRFEQEGYDGLMQLREVYGVTVDAFLIPNTFPGTYIFVDPRGFAPSTEGYTVPGASKSQGDISLDQYELSRYGIGGYYMIIQSEHSIAEGVRSTQLTAQWVAEKSKNNDPPQGDGAKVDSPPDKDTVKKCSSRRRRIEFPDATILGNTEKDTVSTNPDWNSDLGESDPSEYDPGDWNAEFGESPA